MLNKISISHLIWYLVPGICAMGFVMFPIAVFFPSLLKSFIETISLFGILVLGVIFGFILDGLRVYRLKRGYNAVKDDFFKKLLKIFESEEKHDRYFILTMVADHAAKNENTSISFNHAIWIMHGNLAMLSTASSIVWVLIGVFIYFYYDGQYEISILYTKLNSTVVVIASAFLALIFLIAGNRMSTISIEEQKNTNDMFLGYARSNLKVITDLIAINKNDNNEANEAVDNEQSTLKIP